MKLQLTPPRILSVIFWVLSIVLAFKIEPSSRYIWIPDTFLLFGFYPLLISGQARWLWLIFGVLDMGIGWTLALSTCIPDAIFAPHHLVEIKKHIELYHPFIVWLLIGFISSIIGSVILITGFILWLLQRFKGRQS